MDNPETAFISGKTVVYREEVSTEKFCTLREQMSIVVKNDKPYRVGSKYIYQDDVNYDCKVYLIELVVGGPNYYIKEDEVGLLLQAKTD